MNRAKGVLIDTNLLLLYLLGRLSETLIGGKRIEKYTLADFQALCKEVEKFGWLCTTPHVMTEVSNLGGSALDGKYKLQFFDMLSELAHSITEQYDPTKQLAVTPIFRKFGMTDAAIYQVCLRKKLVIITDDFPLANYAHTSGLEVINFNHIRQHIIGI